MENNRIWPVFLSIAAVAVLMLGVFAAWQPSDPGKGHRLRLAINLWPGYELLYVAKVKNFYEQEGLDVELIQFSTLDDARRSFERGQVDGIATTLVDVVQVFRSQGEMPRVILAADYSDGGDAIVARGNGTHDLKSLKGKTVGVEQMFGRFILDRALSKAGLSLGDVRMVETSVLGASRLLQRGEVDAIVTYVPYVFETLKVKGTRTIFTTKETPGEVFDVVATREEHLRRIPDLQGRMTRVWKRSMEFLRDNPVEAHEIMARREGISVAEFKEALAGVRLIPAEQQAAMLAPKGPVAGSLAALLRVHGLVGGVEEKSASPEDFLPRVSNVGLGN